MSLKKLNSKGPSEHHTKKQSFKKPYEEFKNTFLVLPTTYQRECDDERILEMKEKL
jgi:hypothetical protein